MGGWDRNGFEGDRLRGWSRFNWLRTGTGGDLL
jgi:hypothetical protein